MSTLAVRTVEKPWGRDQLPAPFVAPFGKRIGEIWFEPVEEVYSLLVKYIFTSEKLSVQVHPDDTQAKHFGEYGPNEGFGGKEECWLVIDAEPGAALFLSELAGADLRLVTAATFVLAIALLMGALVLLLLETRLASRTLRLPPELLELERGDL